MMFDDIEKTIEQYCRDCEWNVERAMCGSKSCLAHTLKSIYQAHEEEMAKINIDELFEEELNGQISLFEEEL